VHHAVLGEQRDVAGCDRGRFGPGIAAEGRQGDLPADVTVDADLGGPRVPRRDRAAASRQQLAMRWTRRASRCGGGPGGAWAGGTAGRQAHRTDGNNPDNAKPSHPHTPLDGWLCGWVPVPGHVSC
jgi:hypothetical protein